ALRLAGPTHEPRWRLALSTFMGIAHADGTIEQLDGAQSILAKAFDGVDPKDPNAPRVMILDEGGHLIEALHRSYPEYAHLCFAVEQTQAGLDRLEGLDLLCPVFSVAGAWAKKLFEAPFIGENVVDETE